MSVVCDETAKQKARSRAEKEGQMKELLEQYNRIQATAIGLRHANQDIPGLVDDHTIEVMINKIGLRMHTLAHEIVGELQQQLDANAKQSDKGPEPINNVLHKPLWARVPKGNDDDCWRQNKGHFGQVAYHLFTSREEAEMRITDGYKVVPVWGE
jgi:hypothetical protein